MSRSLGRLGFVTGQNPDYVSETKLSLAPSGTDTRTTNLRMSDWAIFDVPDTNSTPPIDNAISNTAGTLYQNETKLVTLKFKQANGSSGVSPPIGFATTQGIDGSKFDRGEASNPQTNAYVNSTADADDKWKTNIGDSTYTGTTPQAMGNWIRYLGDAYNLSCPGTGTSNSNKRYAYYNLLGGSRPGGGRSDIRWKQNIERVGTSQLGLPIFEFEYIDSNHGQGRFRGTIAQELIKLDYTHATCLDKDNYFWVDYDKIDIEFEQC